MCGLIVDQFNPGVTGEGEVYPVLVKINEFPEPFLFEWKDIIVEQYLVDAGKASAYLFNFRYDIFRP